MKSRTDIALTTSAKGESGPVRERRSGAKANKDEMVPISTAHRKLGSGDRGAEDLEADQIFAESFSSLDPEDLSEKITGVAGSFHGPAREEPPSSGNDGFEELLEELESADRATDEQTNESLSLAGAFGTTVGPQTNNENDEFTDLLEELDPAERAAAEETSEFHSLPGERGATLKLQKSDWSWSDTYDPQCILTLEREIIRHQEKERKIGALQAQKEKLKRRYEDIHSLL
jgi:hypothetical protein